jgi:prevent-host-death family protein
MGTYDLIEADGRLSKLVEQATKGEPFLIAKNGKPLARVAPVEEVVRPERQPSGFKEGEGLIPGDFNRMQENEIVAAFEGRRELFCEGRES